jgi:hypothetical protein
MSKRPLDWWIMPEMIQIGKSAGSGEEEAK